jgi:hypothetical protein
VKTSVSALLRRLHGGRTPISRQRSRLSRHSSTTESPTELQLIDGVTLLLVSAFRSVEQQRQIIERNPGVKTSADAVFTPISRRFHARLHGGVPHPSPTEQLMEMQPMSNNAALTDLAPTAAHESATLSPDRAFVVHFYAAGAGSEIEAGRAEHVRSGRTTHFRSWEELAAFVTETVGTLQR